MKDFPGQSLEKSGPECPVHPKAPRELFSWDYFPCTNPGTQDCRSHGSRGPRCSSHWRQIWTSSMRHWSLQTCTAQELWGQGGFHQDCKGRPVGQEMHGRAKLILRESMKAAPSKFTRVRLFKSLGVHIPSQCVPNVALEFSALMFSLLGFGLALV